MHPCRTEGKLYKRNYYLLTPQYDPSAIYPYHLMGVGQSLGQKASCFCDREKLQCKAAQGSCWLPLQCLWMPCFWQKTSTCSQNHPVFFPLYLVLVFTSSGSILCIFFLPHNLFLMFSILNPIYLYVCGGGCISSTWTDTSRAVH